MEMLIGFFFVTLVLIGTLAIVPPKSTWILGVVLFIPIASHANAFKCTDSAGKLTFSDTPCPTNAVKGEKIMGRGAGFNPLSPEEKVELRTVMLLTCPVRRSFCECIADTMADTLTYEEAMQTNNNRGLLPASAQAKAESAGRSCAAKGMNQ